MPKFKDIELNSRFKLFHDSKLVYVKTNSNNGYYLDTNGNKIFGIIISGDHTVTAV